MYITMCLKTLFLYFFIVMCYRIMGKKEVGELGIIDLIVTILIAELAAICIEKANSSILISILPILVLVVLEILLSFLSMNNYKIRNYIDGKPSMIIKKGKVCFSEMNKLRYNLNDLISQLREKDKIQLNQNYIIYVYHKLIPLFFLMHIFVILNIN